MSAHTPGPWTVHPDFPTLVVAAGMSLVARTDTRIMDEAVAPERERQNPANARLIAAVPTLKDELRALIKAIDAECPALRRRAAQAALEVCRAEGTTEFAEELAALAKAEGRR